MLLLVHIRLVTNRLVTEVIDISRMGIRQIVAVYRIPVPFCRECGKEIQADWVSCPYCSSLLYTPTLAWAPSSGGQVRSPVVLSGSTLEVSRNHKSELDAEFSSERNFLARVVAVVCWFFPFIIVSNMIIGGVVGGIVGAEFTSYEDGAAAAEKAVPEFFENYGLGIFLTQLVLFSVLTYEGILPGTSRHKSS